MTDLTTRTNLPASKPPAKPERDDSADYGRRGAVSQLADPFAAFGNDDLADDLDRAFGGGE